MRNHKEREAGKGTREKEGRGGEGWQQWKPVSLPLGLAGLTFSSHRPNIKLGLEPVCPWLCHYLLHRQKLSQL